MDTSPKANPLIAVDGNVVLDLADDNEDVLDAIATIRERLPTSRFVLTPSVFQELVHVATRDPAPARREWGLRALRHLKRWRLDLIDIVPVAHGIVERIAERLREAGLLPREEVHDSLIVAEAALLGCTLLLSSDTHLRAIDHERLTWELRALDVNTPLIAAPRSIVRRFFR
jgi:predicted nucleic acid-binding protein